MLDNQQIKNNWPTIKSHVLSHWRRLSENEVEKTNGNINSLGKLIEESYGAKEDFDIEYEELVASVIKTNKSSYTPEDPRKQSSESTMHSEISADTIMAEGAMDKDRDDMYLFGPNGVSRKAEINSTDLTESSRDEASLYEDGADGFHNLDRSSKRSFSGDPGHKLEEELLKPDLKGMEAEEMFNTPMRELNSIDKKHLNNKHKNIKQAPDEVTTNQDPRRKGEDITTGRSNSSANTTSKSALTSSVALSKDTKKL